MSDIIEEVTLEEIPEEVKEKTPWELSEENRISIQSSVASIKHMIENPNMYDCVVGRIVTNEDTGEFTAEPEYLNTDNYRKWHSILAGEIENLEKRTR
jgi:hypothetical protein